MTAALTTPKTCKGCSGKGYIILASGMSGHHFICDGTGQVEGDRATKAATKAALAERHRVRDLLHTLAFSNRKTGYKFGMASDALDILLAKEPARYAKALASLEAGRTDLVDALAAYYTANR